MIAILLSVQLALAEGQKSCPHAVANAPTPTPTHEQIYQASLQNKPSTKTYADTQKEALLVQQLLTGILADVPHQIHEISRNLDDQKVQLELSSRASRFAVFEGEFRLNPVGYYLPHPKNVDPSNGMLTHFAEYNVSKNAAKVEHLNFFKNPGFQPRPNTKFLFFAPDARMEARLGRFMPFLSLTTTPVGAYGHDFSVNLMKTTALMMDMIFSDAKMEEISKKIYTDSPTLTTQHMARVKESHALGPLAGVLEGVISLHQVISALLSEPVPGSQTGSQALRALVRGGQSQQVGLVAEFTARLPMGVIGPMTHGGFTFTQPLKVGPEGRLVMSEQLTQTLANLVKIMVKNKKPKSRCPMSSMLVKLGLKSEVNDSSAPDISALQVLAESYLRTFEMVERASLLREKK